MSKPPYIIQSTEANLHPFCKWKNVLSCTGQSTNDSDGSQRRNKDRHRWHARQDQRPRHHGVTTKISTLKKVEWKTGRNLKNQCRIWCMRKISNNQRSCMAVMLPTFRFNFDYIHLNEHNVISIQDNDDRHRHKLDCTYLFISMLLTNSLFIYNKYN